MCLGVSKYHNPASRPDIQKAELVRASERGTIYMCDWCLDAAIALDRIRASNTLSRDANQNYAKSEMFAFAVDVS